MDPEQADTHLSYWLRLYREGANPPDAEPEQRFVLQTVSGDQPEQAFSSIEQVIDYLLDQLQVPRKSDFQS